MGLELRSFGTRLTRRGVPTVRPKSIGLLLLGTTPTALLALFLSTTVTLATVPCYTTSNGATDAEYQQSNSKGLQSTVDLVSGTPFDPNTTAIVHPAQIASSSSTDFVGWGTAKGVGVPGTDCATSTTSRWQVYVDGAAFGTYFCRQTYGSEPDVASNQAVEIIHTTCSGSTRWAFFWNGAQKTCQLFDGVSGLPSVGGESIAHDPQHIDVHYKALTYRVLGGTWTPWSAASFCTNAPYYYIVYGGNADIYPKEQ
jgi:hypothetical protein